MSRKRKAFTIGDKLDMIRKVDENPHLTKVQVATMLNVPQSTLKMILKKRDDLLKKATETATKCKKVRPGKYAEMENVLAEWFQQVRASNIPVGGPILKEKAEEIALKMGIEFSASNGWIDRFKKRYGIVYRQINGEANAVSETTVEAWIETTLPHILSDYEPKDVFNADEFGLFFNLLPSKTLSFRGEECHGGKLSKERITVLLCTNEDGSEKLKPLVIGKSRNPRCFKHIRSLPCEYSNSGKAWITGPRFKEFLYSLDARMGLKNRKILLFIDRCSAHPPDVELRNVKVIFLPANTTSKLQPLDQGIIKCVKHHFRQRVVKRLLRHLESEADKPLPKVSILDALHYLAASWLSVTPEIIANCFRKSGFRARQVTTVGEELGLDLDETAAEEWNRIQESMDYDGDFADFVNIDDDTSTCAAPSIDNLPTLAVNSRHDESSDDDDNETVPLKPPTMTEALVGLQKFGSYLASIPNVNENIFQSFYELENYVVKHGTQAKKQMTLDNFFHK